MLSFHWPGMLYQRDKRNIHLSYNRNPHVVLKEVQSTIQLVDTTVRAKTILNRPAEWKVLILESLWSQMQAFWCPWELKSPHHNDSPARTWPFSVHSCSGPINALIHYGLVTFEFRGLKSWQTEQNGQPAPSDNQMKYFEKQIFIKIKVW